MCFFKRYFLFLGIIHLNFIGAVYAMEVRSLPDSQQDVYTIIYQLFIQKVSGNTLVSDAERETAMAYVSLRSQQLSEIMRTESVDTDVKLTFWMGELARIQAVTVPDDIGDLLATSIAKTLRLISLEIQFICDKLQTTGRPDSLQCLCGHLSQVRHIVYSVGRDVVSAANPLRWLWRRDTTIKKKTE